jgi:hypothetical protein
MLYKQTRITLLTIMTVLSFTACSSKSKHQPPPHNPPIVRDNADSNVTKKAFIVAVHDYAGNAHDLDGIDIDANNMHNLFRSWGFDVNQSQHPMLLQAQLDNYAQTLKEEDVFIFYYSGHGTSTPDTSHDEFDGMDELIVLSDSDTNLFILDDKINIMLNKIKARKLIIFDSCNSGTALKVMATTPTPANTKIKYILAPKGVGDNAPQNSQVPNTPTQGTYLFFAACKDNEESLASDRGSLYTNAFKSNVILNQSAKVLLQKTRHALQSRFTPQLSASQESLKSIPLRDYLKIKP